MMTSSLLLNLSFNIRNMFPLILVFNQSCHFKPINQEKKSNILLIQLLRLEDFLLLSVLCV